ncbi:MAG: single-stranded DNA-binding protein [Chitinophagaceae bacterium]|nr:single-stranded DNA-binding protein [Chitinophagaceae bacterium]
MELVGRITKDAVVNQLKDERKVVSFSIAVNDYYKPKNGEGVKITTYVNCSYWISEKIAERLTKATLVEISGRIFVNAYKGADEEAKASLNCHVNNIKIHSFGKQELTTRTANSQTNSNKEEVAEDLPF